MIFKFMFKDGTKPSATKPLIVKLDRKVVGEIHKVGGGYQYFPKESKTGGEIFRSLYDTQMSLYDETA